jgi:hypothetical protein
MARSAKNRSGARFGKAGAWEGARFRDAPAQSAVPRRSRSEPGSGVRTGGGRFGNPVCNRFL